MRTRGEAAGTFVWEDKSITQKVNRDLLLEQVVPAVEQLCPQGEWASPQVLIRIQQDGLSAHIKPDNGKWLEGLEQKGLENKILLYTQPANSPDLNINNLGFFSALQAYYQ